MTGKSRVDEIIFGISERLEFSIIHYSLSLHQKTRASWPARERKVTQFRNGKLRPGNVKNYFRKLSTLRPLQIKD